MIRLPILLILLTFLGMRHPLERDYLQYHLSISEIEELLSLEAFVEAEQRFEQVFAQYEYKFAKDIVVAAQIALLNQHKEKSLEWLEEAIKSGVTLDCLQAMKLLQEQLTTEDWARIKSKYQDWRKEYLARIDLNLMMTFSKNYEAEQEAKRSANYQELVDANFNQIQSIVSTRGFPGERMIGIDQNRFAPSIHECSLGNSKVIVTLLHYDYPISTLGEEVFIEAINKGELHPRDFAKIYNYEKNKISVLYKTSLKAPRAESLPDYQFNFPFGKKIADLERVNKDRLKFGICTYEVDLKKMEISKKHGLQWNYY